MVPEDSSKGAAVSSRDPPKCTEEPAVESGSVGGFLKEFVIMGRWVGRAEK